MTIEEGLVAQLKADSAVAAIVGTRIHPGAIPQDGALPAVVYQLISSPREVDLGGPSTFIRARYQIDCWANSQSTVRSLADSVRAALNGVGLQSPKTLGSEPVQLVYLDDETGALSEFEGDRRDRRVSQDWIIIYTET